MKEKTFDEYYDENPRKKIPDRFMQKFVQFAIEHYKQKSEEDGNVEAIINWNHVLETDCENEEDFELAIREEVEDCIGNAMEILLLFKEFMKREKSK